MVDIGTVIVSAMDQMSVTGPLDLAMDGVEAAELLGHPTDDDVKVLVVVRPARAPTLPAPDAM